MRRPEPIDNEIKLSQEQYIVSRTDSIGVIEYGNDYFYKICGYTDAELHGQPHNIIRHPDMPRILFKMMWERISKGEDIRAIVKNLAKDGSYYWVVTEFEPKIDPVTGKTLSHTAFRRHVPQKVINAITPIYKKLLEIEKTEGMQGSEAYLLEYLQQHNTTYDEFITNLVSKQDLFKRIFQF